MGLFDFFKKKVDLFTEAELVEANVCPNCWGEQAYDDKYVEFAKDQTKAAISGDKTHQKAFIQQFVQEHVSGIKLKTEGTAAVCSACKKSYR